MRTGLIGSTGLVGSTLLRQTTFAASYHRPDIDGIHGQRFDLLVCAAAPAEKWRANQDPDADRANLDALVSHVQRAEATRVLLISTIDVYAVPLDVDESTAIDPSAGSAYGRHRYWLEGRFRELFDDVTVVRLPGLFGRGLKKNVLFDLLHERNFDLTHADSRFQFYDLSRLWADLSTVLAAGVDLVDFATEPVRVGDLASSCFGVEFTTVTEAPPVTYDMKTVHADLFGRSGPYLVSRDETIDAISAWVDAERKARES